MKREKEKTIVLNTYSTIVDGEYFQKLRAYEADKAKYGDTYGEEPKAPKGGYTKKYYNADAYQLDQWFPMWDDKEECEIILAQITNLMSSHTENLNIKMTKKQFLNVIGFFNCVFIDLDDDGTLKENNDEQNSNG